MTNIDVVSSRTASSFAQRFPDRGALRQRSVLSGRSFREISVPRFILAATKYFASFWDLSALRVMKIHAVKINFSMIRAQKRKREKERKNELKRFCAESQETCTCARGKRVVVIIIGRKTQRVPSSGNYPVIKATDYRSEFCGAWTGNCDTAYPTE